MLQSAALSAHLCQPPWLLLSQRQQGHLFLRPRPLGQPSWALLLTSSVLFLFGITGQDASGLETQ